MIDGYSVPDAASVLGVPEGRVWELLARGVLSGTPDGDSMRVYLKAQMGPIATSAPRDVPLRSNGNGGSHGPAGEASAFRELLTEFRNLTERYGQALLALGEARGEVAGLRSRVELLEARLDLRLPAPLDPAPVAWESSAGGPPAPEPPAPALVEPLMPTPAPVRRAPRPRRTPTTRAAVASFADALARAQDPSVADVGHVLAGHEPAPAAPTTDGPPVVETSAEATPADPVEPAQAEPAQAESAPAESAPAESAQAESAQAEIPAPTYSAAVVEPDWFADGDFAWLDAADLEARSRPAEVVPAPAESEPSSLPEPELSAEPAPELTLAELAAVPGPVPEPLPVAPAPGSLEPVEVRASSGDEVEWRAVGAAPAPERELASITSLSSANPELRARETLEAAGVPTTDTRTAIAPALPPPLTMTERELAQLARDEGWDEQEVAAIRAMIRRPGPPLVQLPGAAELDEAMAALQAVPVGSDAAAVSGRQWAKPTTPLDQVSGHDDWAFAAETTPPPTPDLQPLPVRRSAVADPNWLRRRRGPAAEAYRRLRRLFPG